MQLRFMPSMKDPGCGLVAAQEHQILFRFPPVCNSKKRILVPPDVSRIAKALFIKDGIINFIGFIPFGFFISFWLIKVRQWNKCYTYIIAIFLGFLVSMTIEMLQIYLPVRASSMTDLFCNTLGAFLGVFLFYCVRRKVDTYIEFSLSR
jgi:glycopeptide antibiotics resistance protein